MISQWLYCVPGVIYSLFIGSLVDRFGKMKLLVFFPIFGTLLSQLCMLINYLFINTFPVEVFYLRGVGAIFGGMSVYYLGIYGYGAAVSNSDERAHRLAIFDGFEQVKCIIYTFSY